MRTSIDFRGAYLKSLGFTEQPLKDSYLEAELNEDIIDIEKLRRLVEKYELPFLFRPSMWKLLLGLLGAHTFSSHIDYRRASCA